MAYRVDMAIAPLRPPRRMSDGRLVGDALITMPGVFAYLQPDGSIRRELRLPEDVFRPASMASYELAPVTNDHPPRLLDTTTMRRYAVGAVGAVRRDAERLCGPLAVFDAATIADMERGKTATSAGYEMDLIEEGGEHPQYGRYDARQINIMANHVAIVDAGRAGPEARVRMDAGDTPVGVWISPARARVYEPPRLEMSIANILGAMGAPGRFA